MDRGVVPLIKGRILAWGFSHPLIRQELLLILVLNSVVVSLLNGLEIRLPQWRDLLIVTRIVMLIDRGFPYF